MKRARYIVLGIIFILLLAALYFTFYYKDSCGTYTCFSKAMEKCKKVTYLNEQSEATWYYEILGKSKETCAVQVTMLQAKEAELSATEFERYSMVCYYPLGVSEYPEKDLGRCTGRLKEELQSVIIKKLHTLIINNLDIINQSVTI